MTLISRKILQKLNKAGLLKSFKGSGGGFSLIVSPDKISVFDVIEIFQEKFHLNGHTFRGRVCPEIKKCRLKKKIDMIEKNIIEELKAIKIGALVKESNNSERQHEPF